MFDARDVPQLIMNCLMGGIKIFVITAFITGAAIGGLIVWGLSP